LITHPIPSDTHFRQSDGLTGFSLLPLAIDNSFDALAVNDILNNACISFKAKDETQSRRSSIDSDLFAGEMSRIKLEVMTSPEFDPINLT
jgi:hypothetical protein